MAIMLNTPEVAPATDAVSYPEIWMTNFQIDAMNPNQPVRVHARIVPARTLQDGSKEVKRDGGKTVMIQDFFEDAKTDPELLTLMGALITKVKALAGV